MDVIASIPERHPRNLGRTPNRNGAGTCDGI